MTLHACIICGDSGFSYLENPILFCYTCKGNLNEEQMIRIQKALTNADLTEFRAELRQAKLWSDNIIKSKNTEIDGLIRHITSLKSEIKQLKKEKTNQHDTIQKYQDQIKQLTESKNGNVMLLRRAQELGLEAMAENRDIRKLVGSMRHGIGEWFKNNSKYDNTPTMSTYESYQSTDEVLQQVEKLFK